ncbi:MAG TPA: hypothetical protein VE988_18805 [Gemmataceae bacterium]|nr:hypothetical protein [Gemmataceae bacterium]
MKKLVALCGFSFAVLTAAAAPQGQEEPRFNGKALSAWAAQLKDKDIPNRIAAAKALEQMGPQAKAAFGDLTNALKERTWELWCAYVSNADSNSAQKRFDMVSNAIGAKPDNKLTPAEEIERLKQKVTSLEKELFLVQKRLVDDEYLRALAFAMVKIDDEETKRIFIATIQTTTTFSSVSPTIGDPVIDNNAKSKK